MPSTIISNKETTITNKNANGTLPGSQIKIQTTPLKNWKEYQKILFRIAFIFFISLSIPNSVE